MMQMKQIRRKKNDKKTALNFLTIFLNQLELIHFFMHIMEVTHRLTKIVTDFTAKKGINS